MPPRPVPFQRIIRDAAALGMTGKAPGAPCKRCRAGSIPAFSTGSEGDGNPPGLGPGQTRFDSEVPDHTPLDQQAEHPLKSGKCRFDSCGVHRALQALRRCASPPNWLAGFDSPVRLHTLRACTAMHPTLNRENRVQVSGEVRASRQPDNDRLLSKSGVLRVRIPPRARDALSSNGRTPGSGPGGRGSNPWGAAPPVCMVRLRLRTAHGTVRLRVTVVSAVSTRSCQGRSANQPGGWPRPETGWRRRP